MCGICGILRFDNKAEIDPLIIKKMTEALTHRGPDEGGMYIESSIGLGHRRLSIIDIASGQQPMRYKSHGSLQVVVYNGEIYNHVALRRELEALGHFFETSSDTEVLLAAYAQWTYECVKRLRGMFAFAIWDKHRKILFLAGTEWASNRSITVFIKKHSSLLLKSGQFSSHPQKRCYMRKQHWTPF